MDHKSYNNRGRNDEKRGVGHHHLLLKREGRRDSQFTSEHRRGKGLRAGQLSIIDVGGNAQTKGIVSRDPIES